MAVTLDLEGRTALVSGGTSGIGLAIARAFVSAGAGVLLHGVEPQPDIDRLVSDFGAVGKGIEGVSVDLAARDGGARVAQWALARRNRVDIVVLCAAVQFRTPWLDIDERQFDMQIDVNLRATLQLLQRLVPPMMADGFGRVVTIGSVQQSRPHPEMLVYAATKSALRSIVRNLARQVGPHGVTVNNIAPGAIATQRNADWLHDARRRTDVASRIPLRRIGEAQDCGAMAVLLCSPAGGYVNGADLYIDGGMDVG